MKKPLASSDYDTHQPKMSRPWWSWGIALAAVLPVLFGLWMLAKDPVAKSWTLVAAEGQGQFQLETRKVMIPISNASTQLLSNGLPAGARVQTGQEVNLNLKWSEDITLGLAEDSQAVLPTYAKFKGSERWVGQVTQGSMLIVTGRKFKRDDQLRIVTSDAEALLSNSTAAIHKDSESTYVCALEGMVSAGKVELDMASIPPGMCKVMYADDRPSVVTEIDPEHAEQLRHFVESNQVVNSN